MYNVVPKYKTGSQFMSCSLKFKMTILITLHLRSFKEQTLEVEILIYWHIDIQSTENCQVTFKNFKQKLNQLASLVKLKL